MLAFTTAMGAQTASELVRGLRATCFGACNPCITRLFNLTISHAGGQGGLRFVMQVRSCSEDQA